ncbi:MAG: hypothetical protein PHT52_01835 [Eubacteriales bacterium]|nr:hypothetical protein [Eubacteriales bacterium]MDD4768500.1 hypothetical protein [Eubacteriales bacterium]HBI57189.1 hypothetical protein [Bacillota bacterium]HBS93274.1 hypothetical protein [Bacillota bacterium]HCX78930.1 hypothetical protein [Bacillota bacterium]
MKLLENPEIRYGPLPGIEAAQKLLEPRLDLQVYEGAMDYLELHLSRVQECYATLMSRDRGFWAFMQKLRAKKAFTNTTLALRMIMVFHQKNPFVLNQMVIRIKRELEKDNELKPHYEYLLRLLKKLGSREAGAEPQ